MPGDGKVSGVGLGAVTAGALFLYSGVRGYSLLTTLQDIVTGKSPAKQAQTLPIGTPASTAAAAAAGGPASNSAIAANALTYIGHAYLYGGSPGPDGTSPWDCSSMDNWVLGHNFGLTLPGGLAGYDGASHGPTTMDYLGWSGAQTTGHTAAAALAGDLCVWQTHMGIATGAGNMVSALNPQLGTLQTTIADAAPPGELLFVRRVSASYAGAESAGAGAAGSAGG